ncbi:putative histone-lysine n-methyltransferase [Phaeomoniella chlamydospora]|uniref:Putative histone-lysine n-methyltransferase n=1 Tax=Phaeomoniella chlamydospora TaxID=158046 RepID=A0A0G2EBX9_PHACM|nr:putative histone-lysine n-methyltransferase [Phaeomoniella chlamydospora]
MERSQRNRVPTAKAAEAGKGSDAQVDLKSLPIVTPEYSDLPADGVFFESAAEIPKINPSHKVSSTTGEKIQLYHLGQHLESKDRFNYTRAKGDPKTGLFHNTEAPPYYARISDEMHPICNISEFTMDFLVGKDMLTSQGVGQHQTVKANVCAREGSYFFETKLHSCRDSVVKDGKVQEEQTKQAAADANDKKQGSTLKGCPSIGFARREHGHGYSLGSSSYSYAVCAYGSRQGKDLRFAGMPIPVEGMPEIFEGDVVGLLITLPSLDEHRQIVEAPYDPNYEESTPAEGKLKQEKKDKRNKNKKKKAKAKGKAVDESTQLQTPVAGPSSSAAPVDEKNPEVPSTVDIIHERYPIRAKGGVYFESSEYQALPELKPRGVVAYRENPKKISNGRPYPRQPYLGSDSAPAAGASAYHDWPSLRGLPGSKIELWVNGKYVGVVAQNLLAFLPPASIVDVQKKGSLPPNMHSGLWDDGTLGYYPAISHYADSITEFKFDEPFWFGHDGRPDVKPFGRRYEEAIVEDMVSDMIDEIQWEVEHRAQQQQ